MCRLGILPFTSIYIRSPMSCLDTGLLFQEPPDRLITLTTIELGETPAWMTEARRSLCTFGGA